MSINFKYEITKVDNDYGVMEVVYKREGFDDIKVGVRLPLETETVSYVVNAYAPINQWRLLETPFSKNVKPGEKGELIIDDVALESEDSARSIISERNLMLLRTDWIFMSDSPVPSNIEEWKQYRQDLRDITNQPGFPDNVVWPIEPELIYN